MKFLFILSWFIAVPSLYMFVGTVILLPKQPAEKRGGFFVSAVFWYLAFAASASVIVYRWLAQ